MARNTGGAFDGVGAHGHDIDYAKARSIHEAAIAERRRKHLEGIEKRKADRKAKLKAEKALPGGKVGQTL